MHINDKKKTCNQARHEKSSKGAHPTLSAEPQSKSTTEMPNMPQNTSVSNNVTLHGNTNDDSCKDN